MRPGNHFKLLQKRQSISLPDDEDEDEETSTTASVRTSTTRSIETESSTEETETSTTESITVSTPTSQETSARSTISEASSEQEESSSSTQDTSTSLSVPTRSLRGASSTSTVTNFVVVSGSTVPSVSSTSANSTGGDGPSTGMVVGVVAGGLVGIVVIAGLLGYFFKTKFGKDKDDDIDDAFNKNDFRHESIMLQDDDMDRVSMRSGSAAGSLNVAGMGRTYGNLQRNNTAGLSSYDRGPVYGATASPVNPQFAAAPPMPSFQPGQIVNTTYYHAPASNYAPSEGGWGVAAGYAGQQQHLGAPSGAGLDRQASMASHYGDDPRYRDYPNPGSVAPSYHTLPNEHHDYPPQNGRSGSPVDLNPQQFYEGKPAQNGSNRQLSVRNRNSDNAYDGMGF